MKKIFGTDGIRCIVNQEPMTAETCLKIAKTTGYFLATNKKQKNTQTNNNLSKMTS